MHRPHPPFQRQGTPTGPTTRHRKRHKLPGVTLLTKPSQSRGLPMGIPRDVPSPALPANQTHRVSQTLSFFLPHKSLPDQRPALSGLPKLRIIPDIGGKTLRYPVDYLSSWLIDSLIVRPNMGALRKIKTKRRTRYVALPACRL